MTLLPEKILSGEIEAPDLFCGGTPCQAFSVAGLRNSLDDARGNLSLTFVGIANAIDHVRSIRGNSEGIIFWENVPGVLNTKDNAFGCFLGALAGEDDPLLPPGEKWSNAGCVYGPQRTVAWRVFDAQYFGVAQRRRRVFVIASARKDFDPTEVLFEFEGVRRDFAPSRQEGKVTPTISSSGTGVSRVGFNCEDEWFIETPVVGALDTECGGRKMTHQTIDNNHLLAARMVAFGEYSIDGTASAMKARDWKDATDLVAQPIPIHDQATRHAGKNGEKTMGKGNGLGIGQPGDPMNTLTKGDHHAVFQAMAVRRLTPTECERLQGFPDGYTNIPWRKAAESPDGPRYKALGNSWAVPVVRWIGARIASAVSF
jgi:DNA (cytosine-5)-methyltransferase 1